MKPNTFLLQPIETINAPRIKEIVHILEGIFALSGVTTECFIVIDARSDPRYLKGQFPPSKEQTPLGDVFTSCNWVIRDG
jgi:ATP-dependent DNA helicase 2 subunit 1